MRRWMSLCVTLAMSAFATIGYGHDGPLRLHWKDMTFFDENGNTVAGGHICTWDAPAPHQDVNTMLRTPRTTYQDRAGQIANTHPIVLNSNGTLVAPVYVTHGQWSWALSDSDDPKCERPIAVYDWIPGAEALKQ